MPPNASPELQEELKRQWLAAQQQQAVLAQSGGQAIRANQSLGRGLVIPGAPNTRPMPIRPNTGNSVPLSLRLPNGAAATAEQVQHIMKRQLAMANGQNVPSQQQMQRLRALHQQAQLNAAQQAVAAAAIGGQNATTSTVVTDYIPFVAQTNGQGGQGTD